MPQPPGTPPLPPGLFPQGNNSEWARSGNILDGNLIASRRLKIPYSSWLSEVEQPVSIFPPFDLSFAAPTNTPTLPYSKTITDNLAYLDIDDFLIAIAQGKPVDKIYDTPGYTPYSTRWNAASNFFRSVSVSQVDPLSFQRALTGNNSADFRDGPASSDGDIIWQEKKYFQVNNQQAQALKKNPFITPEFQTIADPNRPGKSIQVARYDYPTSADFEKFSDYLSDATKQTLSAAKAAGKLANPASPETRALTKQMLTELTNVVFTQFTGLTRPDVNLLMTSIHPFNEMNIEAASAAAFPYSKMLYSGNRTIPGKPDPQLLMTRESFHALTTEGSNDTLVIQRAFARAEAENPNFPKYFDVPEIWQVGRNISNIGSDPAAFVQQSKAIYQSKAIAPCVIKNISAQLK